MKNLVEYIELVLQERSSDKEILNQATQSYLSILKLLRKLRFSSANEFSKYFWKENGKFVGIYLDMLIPLPEHEKLVLYLGDSRLWGGRNKVKGFATRTSDRSIYAISLHHDVPDSIIHNTGFYNKYFSRHAFEWFSEPETRDRYFHEFTHVFDFKRLSDDYLTSRKNNKASSLDARKKDFSVYVNDPLETNAHIIQSFSKIAARLRKAKTEEHRRAILGDSPSEFIDMFMSKYLHKRALKHFSEKNLRSVIKRALQFYQRETE